MPKYVLIPNLIVEAPGEYEAAKALYDRLADMDVFGLDVFTVKPDGTFSYFESTHFKRVDVSDE